MRSLAARDERVAAALWALASALGAALVFLTVSFAGLGFLLAVPLFAWLGRHAAAGRGPYGAMLGVAVLPALIAAMHWDYQPCPAPAADRADGSWSCGGTDPMPYVVAALVIASAFVVAWLLTPRGRPFADGGAPEPHTS